MQQHFGLIYKINRPYFGNTLKWKKGFVISLKFADWPIMSSLVSIKRFQMLIKCWYTIKYMSISWFFNEIDNLRHFWYRNHAKKFSRNAPRKKVPFSVKLFSILIYFFVNFSKSIQPICYCYTFSESYRRRQRYWWFRSFRE